MRKLEESGCISPREGKCRALPPWKRSLDLVVVILAGIPFLLVAGLVALIHKRRSPGPLFFKQPRVGYKGQEFVCYKFRTMQVDADTDSHRAHTQHLIKSAVPMDKLDVQKDPRLIPLGALLRAGGLDELPQLLNVLRREMSIVGPRPCIRYECEQYEPWHWHRFDAVPGLTGLWQVSGKNRTTFEEMVQLDIKYSLTRSLVQDLWIIIRTPFALIRQFSDLMAARLARRSTSKPTRCEPAVDALNS